MSNPYKQRLRAIEDEDWELEARRLQIMDEKSITEYEETPKLNKDTNEKQSSSVRPE